MHLCNFRNHGIAKQLSRMPSAAGSLPVSPSAVPVSPALFRPHAVIGNANKETSIRLNIFPISQLPLSLFQIFSEIPEFFQL